MTDDTEFERNVLDAFPDPFFVVTETGRYAAVLGGRDRSMYHDVSSLAGRRVRDVLSPGQADWVLEQIRLSLDDNALRVVEYAFEPKDIKGLDARVGPTGSLWFEGRIQPLARPVDGERAVLWLASNITRRHELEIRLRQLSETDELTGLSNRRCLMDRLEAMLIDYDPERSRIALLLIDIDRFKRINDRYGHPNGDLVLKTMSGACGARIKRRDLLARLGGEEFATLLHDTTAEQALFVAERLRNTIEQTEIQLDSGEALKITISIGVSVAAPERRRSHDLLSHADRALYMAKANGRNRVALAEECRPRHGPDAPAE